MFPISPCRPLISCISGGFSPNTRHFRTGSNIKVEGSGGGSRVTPRVRNRDHICRSNTTSSSKMWESGVPTSVVQTWPALRLFHVNFAVFLLGS